MKNTRIGLATLLMGMFSTAALAAPITYTFDTLSTISMDAVTPSLSGVLRNETAPSTVSFVDNTNVSFRFVVNRCVPLFLTMIEKPGRYWLSVTVDPALSNVQLKSCSLSLRS
jgi:hypothetical protein